MTTIETFELAGVEDCAAKVAEGGALSGLGQIFRTLVRRIEERRTIVKLSRLDPRTIRDMGFEPAAIYGALEGTWDELPGDRWRGLDN